MLLIYDLNDYIPHHSLWHHRYNNAASASYYTTIQKFGVFLKITFIQKGHIKLIKRSKLQKLFFCCSYFPYHW